MQDIRNLSDDQLLRLRFRYSGTQPIKHLTTSLQQLGYRIATKNDPAGRDITVQDVKRRLYKALHNHPLYPLGRSATPEDIDRIAVSVIAQYPEDELV